MKPRSQLTAAKESRRVVQALKEALPGTDALASAVRRFRKGEILLREGESNDAIFIILEGKAQLSKNYGTNNPLPVGIVEPGDFVGLISFYSSESVFSTVHARTPLSALCLTREQFNQLPQINPDLYGLLQQLVISSLAERYRRIVNLHLEVATLTQELENERNQLQHALEELGETRNRLIHQEKMAILGQLVAGIAHEINNPTSAVLHSAENLMEILPSLLKEAGPAEQWKTRLLRLGLDHAVIATAEARERMNTLEKQHPRLDRTIIRTLAQIPPDDVAALRSDIAAATTADGRDRLEKLLQFFDVGTMLRSLKISGERIGGIVRSLKAYSREGAGAPEPVDIVKGIQDTLLIAGNRLKNVAVTLEFGEVPPVLARSGELNQVWTNILLNACDAMGDRGAIAIRVAYTEQDEVCVSIADSGPGIPEDILPRIFEPNVTTKAAGGNFGLGLGLAISNEIVQKHGGTITVANTGSGALCTVTLPPAPGTAPAPPPTGSVPRSA
jgi:signal transduction histidine kinase